MGSDGSSGGNGNRNVAGDGKCEINGNVTGGTWHGDCGRGSGNSCNKAMVSQKVGSGGNDEAVDRNMGNGGGNAAVGWNTGNGGDSEAVWLMGGESNKGVKATVNVATVGLSAAWREVFSTVLRGLVALYSCSRTSGERARSSRCVSVIGVSKSCMLSGST